MTEFTINDLYGSAWESAIDEVASVLNGKIDGLHLFRTRDWVAIEQVAESLNIRFTVNGEIIR